ncbi:hypothetical protein [Fundidesulfovibrio agrisoli]|uniref:alpha/beta hydrolase n=1 Tax=Fundidesulfovibrio agrisoli TaxID=2922717 RepID=UPI001FACAD27|nr:hypothetical protein [Fundidesulfovibrio agrisoli]
MAGPYPMRAARDAPTASGRFPVIVLSHGSGGSELGHRDWAAHLARNGYIVIAPRHLGDSYDAPEGRGSDVQLVGRPWQALAALDAALAASRPELCSDGPGVDRAAIHERIGEELVEFFNRSLPPE